MRLRMSLPLFAAGLAVLSVPLSAQVPRPAEDPNERVCEKQTVVGSRLAVRRVCATRAEWARANSRQSEDARERHDGMTRGPGAIDTRGMGGG